MRTKAFALAGTLFALSATMALAQWNVPFALAPVTVDQDHRVTMDFDSATPQQVLDWLKKAGINFVAETSTLPKDKRLTVHLKDQPADKALEAVAEALGLSYTKKGDVYSLKPGFPGAFSVMSPGQNFEWKELPPSMNGLGPGDAKQWKEWSQELKDSLKDLPKGNWQFKEMPEGTFNLKEMPQIKELLQKQLKEMPELKMRLKQMPDVQKELGDAKVREQVEKALKEVPDMKKLVLPKLEFGVGDIGKLVESLTPQQWDLSKSKGYLTPDDLTPDQRKMLGTIGSGGDFTITFQKEGKTVTFKRK